MRDEERELAPRVESFTAGQRAALRSIAGAMEDLAARRDATRSEVVALLEKACREVTGMQLRDFRGRHLCADCDELFTSAATKREHYSPGRVTECRDPRGMETLELKSGGRWGWSALAVERFRSSGASGRRS